MLTLLASFANSSPSQWIYLEPQVLCAVAIIDSAMAADMCQVSGLPAYFITLGPNRINHLECVRAIIHSGILAHPAVLLLSTGLASKRSQGPQLWLAQSAALLFTVGRVLYWLGSCSVQPSLKYHVLVFSLNCCSWLVGRNFYAIFYCVFFLSSFFWSKCFNCS